MFQIRTYVEYYFSALHIETNENMKSIIESNDDNGWIFIHEILGWPMMRYNSATEKDIIILA